MTVGTWIIVRICMSCKNFELDICMGIQVSMYHEINSSKISCDSLEIIKVACLCTKKINLILVGTCL